MFKIQTFNQISDKGLVRFPKQEYQVSSDVEKADAILVRSAKMSRDRKSVV